LFRALFPQRAQQCLRIPALDRAFLLIDEPQIVDVRVWNLFLRALAVVLGERNGQALLSTATLPPPTDGLGFSPIALAPADRVGARAAVRYRILAKTKTWGPEEVADCARSRLASVGSVAAILNTVRDAFEVYKKAAQGTEGRWFFLASMMLPGHKADRIELIRNRLKPDRPGGPESTGVVCTQILEAGVNLSFRSILRAEPIFSSVAQAAGRANRHGEGRTPAEVVVFPFRRDDNSDSRRFVYCDKTALRHTDGTLRDFPDLPEGRVAEALDEYYRRCWTENPVTACLQLFEEAAMGQWTKIAGLGPFSDEVPEVEVFVPGSVRYLMPELRPLLGRLGVADSDDLLCRYLDPVYRRRLGFLDRKRLSAALRQFTIGVPERLAKQIAQPTDPEHDWLWVLDDPASYKNETGLAHLLGPAEDVESGYTLI
jgi:CRISPR-associated endonuclease/helicase Cas3